MVRQRRQQFQPALPVSQGEVWEMGRREFDIQATTLTQRQERPALLLAVQVGESGGIVLADVIPASTPAPGLAEFAMRAMREPMMGPPRRPERIRVASQVEADDLARVLAKTGVIVEVARPLDMLDAVYEDVGTMFSGMSCDYRTRAAQGGETLSQEGLQEFFRTARTFYRQALWETYGDEVVFEITLHPPQTPARTLYGILLGNLGEEFGLVLYPTLDDLRRFYTISLEHAEQMVTLPLETDEERLDPDVQQDAAEIAAQFATIPSVLLTYSPQREAPPALVQEVQHLKLPLANKSAFPVVMHTGEQGMQVATAAQLGDMYAALRALLAWDRRIDEEAEDDELDLAITSTVKAVSGCWPAMSVQATLRENPCLPEEDEEEIPSSLAALFENLFAASPDDDTAARGKQFPLAAAKQPSPTVPKAAKTVGTNRVYTLQVYLMQGPIPEAFADQEISRVIDIRGNQTLHDLHLAIFKAFERWEEHLYEFNLGQGPADRSQLYFSSGDAEADAEAGNPATTVLDALNLTVDRRFGYTFDLGDQWEHTIQVVGIRERPGKGPYPRVVKKVGAAPPQYPEEDEV